MEKIWKAEQLEKIAANTSIFKHIPTEIGNVLYCDTNQPETVKLGDKEAKKTKVIAISICSIILLLYWSFLYEHYIWGVIITVIALLVTIGVCDTTFSGTDYFVGNKGFATVSFVDSRDNITSSNVYLFKDMEYLFTGETIVKTNYIVILNITFQYSVKKIRRPINSTEYFLPRVLMMINIRKTQ